MQCNKWPAKWQVSHLTRNTEDCVACRRATGSQPASPMEASQ